MVPLVAGIIWLGVYPAPVLRRMEAGRRAVRAHGRDARRDAADRTRREREAD